MSLWFGASPSVEGDTECLCLARALRCYANAVAAAESQCRGVAEPLSRYAASSHFN